jgi:glycosyltransferase involved in cell wall biosynthesis
MSDPVSIIIPCYNAERWVDEAIQSCINQTYAPIEIIVVNDGSTDRSLERLQTYGDKIVLIDVPNGGPARARNLGFERSTGTYIQFLDADDYLMPDKVEQQVAYLKSSTADAVYGDWRHLTHHENGTSEFDEIHPAGAHSDLLRANLTGWWVPPFALMYRRGIVEKSGGWDPNIVQSDDQDFFLSVLFVGATMGYVPRLTGIYRRYGRVTVSTASTEKWVRGTIQTLQKVEQKLQATGQLAQYRTALAHAYYHIAHSAYDVNRALHKTLLQKVRELDAHFMPDKPASYQWIRRTFGLEMAEEVAGLKRRLSGQKAEF